MKNIDYIIVGLGLAGIAFCEACERAGKRVVVFDKGSESASKVAAGLYNPIILKRYSLPYNAVEQFDLAIPYFRSLEGKLNSLFVHDLAVRKVFYSVEDQNNWFAASDVASLSRFVKPEVIKNANNQIAAPFDYGELKETGRVDINTLQQAYQEYLQTRGAFAKAEFVHSELVIDEYSVCYQGYRASHIVFAEGYGVKNNPFFKKLPLMGNKGEYLIIKAPELKLTAAIKSSFFVVPLGDELYKVGATYNWTEKDWLPTATAREELLSKFDKLIKTPYEIVGQQAGMRPTTGDRRPLIGRHPNYKSLLLLNGLGTRGVMASPFLAKTLFNYIEGGAAIPPEIDVMRFPKKFA